MKKKVASKESKIRRCLKAPFRILIKARDLYINNMSACAGWIDFGAGMSCPTSVYVTTLPKSFSVGSTRSSVNDEEFAELVRTASTRNLGKKVELELLRRQKLPETTTGVNVMPRSQSVAIGRIDEDKPCDFGEDHEVFPRSRSLAVSRRNGKMIQLRHGN